MKARPGKPSRSKPGTALTKSVWSRYRYLIALLLLGVIATLWVPGLFHRSLKTILAGALNIRARDLYLNIPPLGQRYPATVILLKAGGYSFYQADPARWNANLVPGIRLQVGDVQDVKSSTRGSSSLLGLAVQNQDIAEVVLEIPDSRPIEPTLPEIFAALPARASLEGLLSGPDEPVVVVRSFEGHIALRMRRKQSTSLEAWGSAGNEAEKVAGDPLSDATVRWEGDRNHEGTLVIESKSPIVFAFEVMPLQKVLTYAPEDSVTPDAARPFVGGAGEAVDALIRIGPTSVPSLPEVVRELGDAGAARVLQVLADGNPARRTAAAQIAAHLPPPRGVSSGPEEALNDSSPRVRAWAVASAMKDGPRGLPLLIRAASDTEPAIRFLVMHAVGELGTQGANAIPALKQAEADRDPVVRFEALHSLSKVVPTPDPNMKPLEDGLKSTDPKTREAAAHYMGRDRLLKLKSGADPSLRPGATEAINKGWAPVKPQN
jgi:hypothetical protein